MKVSLDWLRKYIDVECSLNELVERLTMAGIEVESVETTDIPEKVLVCEILERKAHPNADRLSLCTVDYGDGKIQVVCGAPNCNPGIKTALASEGVILKDKTGKEFKIQKSVIRGVESSGMLCSARELGISEDAAGIIELDTKLANGTAISEVLSQDTILDLEITPNRPDLLSHFGIARDLAAITGKKARIPKQKSFLCPDSAIFAGTVNIQDTELCPSYTARIIRNIKVKESPDWLKQRLKSIGLRPINNIVDVTNFVLHELGHPLHAFDLVLLSGQRIIVRRAGEGEKIVLLDGSEKKLRDSHLVIADAEKPVALAGVMGGEFSGVTEKTTDILLESAYFKPANIRKTSKELEVSSDSSYRFERGADPEMVARASDRATELILATAGGEIASPLITEGPGVNSPSPMTCRFDRIRRILGADIKNSEIVSIFKKLGLHVEKKDKNSCEVTPSSFRSDLRHEADLSEEVARIYGLGRIPAVNVRAECPSSLRNDSYIKTQKARNCLLSLGLDETMTYSLTDEKSAMADREFSSEDIIRLKNPLSLEYSCMRPSLLNAVIQTVNYNVSRKNCDLSLFELGRAFCNKSPMYTEERLECCIALTGRKNPERYSSDRDLTYDFHDIKGIVESFLDSLKIGNYRFEKTASANFAELSCARLLINGKKAGILGEISTGILSETRIRTPLFMAVLDIDSILAQMPESILYKPFSLFPAITRDIALVADSGFENSTFIDFAYSLKIPDLESVQLFDEFRDQSLGSGKKSLAYSITYRNTSRTLTDTEVNRIHDGLRLKISEKLKVELR